ncbi:MAG: hypothetical protein K6U78_03015 [Anaerolineae bacterium]|nr:hypothetical protein [Anaerolineae bacterium]
MTYFSDAELQTLAHDLGVDYEALPGQAKSTKVIQLIQTAARQGKIVDLVELGRAERPHLDWNVVGVAAATGPRQFLFVPDEGGPVLAASPDRALRIGIVLGALMMFLLACGFGGGLLAGQIVRVTLNPVQPDPDSLERVNIKIGDQQFTPQGAGVSFAGALQMLNSLPAGMPFAIQVDNVQATTLADELIKARPDAPVSDPHLRFLASSQISANVRVGRLGNRRVVLAYTARAEGGRIVITPVAAWVNLIEIPNITFGWFPLPQSAQDEATRWVQAELDAAAGGFWFSDVSVEEDRLTIAGARR